MKKNTLLLLLLLTILVFNDKPVFGQLPWTKDANNPVLSGGASGTWNRHVIWPTVLYNADSARYEMWFDATDGPPPSGWRPFRIGFATSPDGITWTMHPDPVLEPDAGTWDESSVEDATIIWENGQYKMWYIGWSPSNEVGGLGYATSPDGITWTKDTLNNPVMVPNYHAWQAGGFSSPHVLPIEGGYEMWYSGWNANWTNSNIGYATSPDGITWTPDTLNNPVLTTGSLGEWDDSHLMSHQVLFIDSVYHMWYTGTGDPSTVNLRQIGWATSTDGIHWNKNSDPVLKFGSVGRWDADRVDIGTVRLEDDTLHLWYSGIRQPYGIGDNLLKIGHATAPYDTSIKIVNGIEDYISRNHPQGFVLSQNYPNPFNPITTIEFSLPKSEFVELKVYNILGKEVTTLVSNKLNQGNHTYTFDGKNLASGIYYYQLVAGDYREVKKMILLR